MALKRRAPTKKRISFTDFEACHLYEWLTRYWGDEPHFGNCGLCQQLGTRLETFIGKPEARRIARMTKRDLANSLGKPYVLKG